MQVEEIVNNHELPCHSKSRRNKKKKIPLVTGKFTLCVSGSICDALRDLVPWAQFKKREKHPWRSVTFSEACNFTKSNTPPWVFFTFLNCTNGTKSRKAPHMSKQVTV